MTASTQLINYKLDKNTREMMYCDVLMDKDDFKSMNHEELMDFIDQKLLEESYRLFLVHKICFEIEEADIKTTFKYIEDDKGNDSIPQDKIRLQFCEELDESNVDIDLPKGIDNLEFSIKGNATLEKFLNNTMTLPEKWYLFTDDSYSFSSSSSKVDAYINSESFGSVWRKYLLIESNTYKKCIDLVDDNLADLTKEFKSI